MTRPRRLRRHAGLLAIVTLAISVWPGGCNVNLDTEDYPTARPKEADLIGTYRATPASRKYITQVGKYPEAEIAIQLMANGRIKIENIPDWWRDGSGHSGGKVDNGEGSWSVTKHQSWWDVGVSFASTIGFANGSADAGLDTQIVLVGKHAPYVLRMQIGDPDSGRAMDFAKAAQPKP